MVYHKTATNPTVRISNLLEEISNLRDWINYALEKQSFTHQIPPPVASSFELGFRLARHRSTYEKQTEQNRTAQRLSRIRRAAGYNIRGSTPYTNLTPEQQAAIDAEIEALGAYTDTTTTQED